MKNFVLYIIIKLFQIKVLNLEMRLYMMSPTSFSYSKPFWENDQVQFQLHIHLGLY
jgi:hypothetical protein